MAAKKSEAFTADRAANDRIVLAGVLDITAAAPLAATLLAQRGKDIRVDASRVERVGTPCLQVLLSAAATWGHDGMDFQVADPSAAFVEALGTAGLGLNQLSARNS